MMSLRLYSLGKKFEIVKTIEVMTINEAKALVIMHLENSGYSNLRTVDDADYSIRFIADPLTGRKGRNVAQIDY